MMRHLAHWLSPVRRICPIVQEVPVPLSRGRSRRSRGLTTGGDFDIRGGAEQLYDIGKMLRQAGDKELRREFYRALQRSAKPLVADAKQNALDTLPKRGGLNEKVAKSKFRTRVRAGGRNPGVRITATGLDARLDTKGRLRHPTFGRRGRGDWFEEKVKPGWFTDAMERGAPQVRKEMLAAMDEVARKLEGR